MEIADTHNDFLTKLGNELIIPYTKNCVDCGVRFLSCSFFSSEMEGSKVLNCLSEKAKILENAPPNFVLHIEDLFFVENEEVLQAVVGLSPFSSSLTWNADNILAGGSMGKKGLTKYGKQVAETLEKNNIIIDTAHLNKKSFNDIVNITNKPLYCSHTGFDFIIPSPRNLCGYQIERIIESKGFIGLFFFKDLISNKEEYSAKTVANNIACFSEKYGLNNLGIGSDFYGIKECPVGLNDYKEFMNLKEELLKIGFYSGEIEKIFYKNLIDFVGNMKLI